MALRILHNELLTHHVGVMQRLLSSERMLSSAAVRPAVTPNNEEGNQLPKKKTVIAPFRTLESDPRNHKENHASRFYTVDPDIDQTLFKNGGFHKKYNSLCHVFTERSIMVRKPFLEVKSYIEELDFSKPAVRIVLHGKFGQGKTLSLAHIVHYGYNAGFLLVHVPWVNSFMRMCQDGTPSESKPGMMDVPLDAAAWLVHFRAQNQHLLQKQDLRTTRPYQYGPRDTIEVGAPIAELVEFGVSRAKYACDVVEDLLREVKGHSSSGKCKTMVVIDGFNGLYQKFMSTKRGKIINARCTLALPFLEITRFDWCNGVIVTSVDARAHPDQFGAESDLPFYLLGKEGWEHLDPFIPVHVDKYDIAEMNSILDYYIDRRWIQHPAAKTQEGRAELIALSGGNGWELARICAPL